MLYPRNEAFTKEITARGICFLVQGLEDMFPVTLVDKESLAGVFCLKSK